MGNEQSNTADSAEVNDPIRFGVVGIGAIGPSHAFAIDKAKGTELAALCSRRPDGAATLAKEYEVPYCATVEELLEQDIDAVALCTPSGLHLDIALQVIDAGKHLLVEKPLEISTERIDRIVAAAEKKGVKLAGVFQSRFKPVVQQLKILMDNGLLGKIYGGSAYIKRYRTQDYYDSGGWRGTWEIDGGGCLMNQGIHEVDLLTWFMGDVAEVIGVTETCGRQVEVETLALALVKYANGARGVLEASTVTYPDPSPYIEIFGARGTLAFSNSRVLRMELVDPTAEEERARQDLLEQRRQLEEKEAQKNKDIPPGTPVGSVDMGHMPAFEDFVRAIRQDREPLVNGPEARRSVELVTAVYESSKNGSAPIRLGEQK